MATSSNASSNGTSRLGRLPVCGCGDVMRLFISNSAENPQRRYWKCVNWGVRGASCKLYVWDDQLDALKIPMVTVQASQSIPESTKQVEASKSSCDCKCGQIFKDWESQKIGKLKQKLLEERTKMKWMQGILILVIVYVAYMKFGLV